jgi:hypothetical protein
MESDSVLKAGDVLCSVLKLDGGRFQAKVSIIGSMLKERQDEIHLGPVRRTRNRAMRDAIEWINARFPPAN